MPLELGELRLYNVDELSERLRVSKDTVRHYLKEGKVKGKKLGVKWYTTEDAVKEYFTANV